MHIHCPLWSSTHRKHNDSATVALFFLAHAVFVLNRGVRQEIQKFTLHTKQISHSSKMSTATRNYSRKWTLWHPAVQRLRSWWDTHGFKSQPSVKGNEDPNLTSSLVKSTKQNYSLLDYFVSFMFIRTFYDFVPNKCLLQKAFAVENLSRSFVFQFKMRAEWPFSTDKAVARCRCKTVASQHMSTKSLQKAIKENGLWWSSCISVTWQKSFDQVFAFLMCSIRHFWGLQMVIPSLAKWVYDWCFLW